MRASLLLCVFAVWGLGAASPGVVAAAGLPGVSHVVLIGVDGLGPDGIHGTETPVLDALIARGAHSFRARAVMPTNSSPNWASMIMGAGPEQHGVTGNDWLPFRHDVAPTVTGPGGIFPTIYSVIREQRPDAFQAVIHHWKGYGVLFERRMVDKIQFGNDERHTTHRAVQSIREDRPYFLFVHLDHVDGALHGHGWLTEEYFEAVREADRLIGVLLEALEESGMHGETIVIVTSDHGGKGTGHGGATMQEIEIPWIIAGPNVRAGATLEEPINTYDTAATIAHVLGLTPPRAWIARPVLEAFEQDAGGASAE